LEFEDMCLKDFAECCEVLFVSGKNKKRLTFPFEVDTGFYKHTSTVQKGPKKPQDATVPSRSKNA
jgi:hypothetical protein